MCACVWVSTGLADREWSGASGSGLRERRDEALMDPV